MSALAFVVSLLYLPTANGFVTPRWALLASVVPFFWYFRPSIWTHAHTLGAIFLVYCALSLTWTFDLGDGIVSFGQLVVLAMLFCVGAGTKDLNAIWIGGALAACVSGALIVGQYFYGWDIVPQHAGPAATFFNKNIAAETAAIVAVGVLGVPKWRWLALGALPAVVLCQSRNVILALGVYVIILIYKWNKFAAAVLGAVTCAVAAHLVVTNYTAIQRFQIWQDTAAGLTFFGRGVGSFWSTFPEHATRIDGLALRPENAHNDLLHAIYELGPGTLALITVLVFAFRQTWRQEHYVLIVFIALGLAAFPLHMPVTAFFAALALGHVCRAGDVVRIPSAQRQFAPVLHRKLRRDALAHARSPQAVSLGS